MIKKLFNELNFDDDIEIMKLQYRLNNTNNYMYNEDLQMNNDKNDYIEKL